MDSKTLERYLTVQTGEDLVRLGVKPKTAGENLALAGWLRIQALLQRLKGNINDEMLGVWRPLLEERVITADAEINNPAIIASIAKQGMRIRATGEYNGTPVAGIEGIILDRPGREDGRIPIRSDAHIGGRAGTCGGRCEQGYGISLLPSGFVILNPTREKILTYDLTENAVADKTRGHRVRVNQDLYFTQVKIAKKLFIARGTTGTVIDKNDAKSTLVVRFDDTVPEVGGTDHGFDFSDAAKYLQVSSLGQTLPLDRDKELRKAVLTSFLARTEMSESRALKVACTIIMDPDIQFYGPPGTGKSHAAEDIGDIFGQIGVFFRVSGCENNCNPYSLFDPTFAKKIDACPQCKERFDANPDKTKGYRKTRFFTRPKPKDVPVDVLRIDVNSGQGIISAPATIKMGQSELAGYVIPVEIGGPAADIKDGLLAGYKYGLLTRSNNGLLILNEVGELNRATFASLLEAISEGQVTPDKLRCRLPADQIYIGTHNEPAKIPGKILDRVIQIRFPRADEVERPTGLKRAALKAIKPFYTTGQDLSDDTPEETTRENADDETSAAESTVKKTAAAAASASGATTKSAQSSAAKERKRAHERSRERTEALALATDRTRQRRA